jgi:NADP-dependent 3-hydroxy acid dehydrogenase YdfG/uncharacterized protein YciI
VIAIVSIVHTAEHDAVAVHVDAHKAFLAALHQRGKLVASGPFAARGGGTVLLRVRDESESAELLRSEPYLVHGVARHDVRFWNPTLGSELFEKRGKLEGKVALVTGASSGIGEATAIALAREGAHVGLAARRIERLDALVERLAAEGRTAVSLAADVSQETDARSLAQRVEKRFGKLDIVVNSAGIMLLSPILEATADEWRRMIDLNLLGLMHVTQAALPLMKRAGGGHIVNVASLAGRIANPNASAYAATKFGVVGFSEAVRREVYKDDIRVTVIEPGVVSTELGEHIENAAMKAGLRDRVAAMDPLQAEDVAAAVLYAVTQPARANVNEILLRPTGQER